MTVSHQINQARALGFSGEPLAPAAYATVLRQSIGYLLTLGSQIRRITKQIKVDIQVSYQELIERWERADRIVIDSPIDVSIKLSKIITCG